MSELLRERLQPLLCRRKLRSAQAESLGELRLSDTLQETRCRGIGLARWARETQCICAAPCLASLAGRFGCSFFSAALSCRQHHVGARCLPPQIPCNGPFVLLKFGRERTQRTVLLTLKRGEMQATNLLEKKETNEQTNLSHPNYHGRQTLKDTQAPPEVSHASGLKKPENRGKR